MRVFNNINGNYNSVVGSSYINGYSTAADNNIKGEYLSRAKARFTRNRIKSLYLDPNTEDPKAFSDQVKSNFMVDVRYSVLFKVKYNDDRYAMLGPQEGFRLSAEDTDVAINSLYNNLGLSLTEFMNRKEYSVNSINLVQVLYVTVEDIPELKLKSISNVKLNKEFVKVKIAKSSFSSDILPLSVNLYYYGKLLVGDDCVKYLEVINKNKSILGHKPETLDDISSMYLYNNACIVLNKNVSNTLITRVVYDLETGKCKAIFTDKILSKDMFTRKRGDLVITIFKDKVVRTDISKSLGIIKNKRKRFSDSAYSNIGSLDLEAYNDSEGSSKVYAIGYNVLGEKPEMFYLDRSGSSSELVIKCFNYMLQPKYHKYIYYCHNFSRYDSIFILKILTQANIDKGFEYYKLKPLYRDGNMLKLDIMIKWGLSNRKQPTIGARKEPRYTKITIIDSYALLNENLYELSRSFDIEVTKSHFPHAFVKEDTLNYKGNTPSIIYWLNAVDKVNNISKEEYKELFSNNWDLRVECLNYLDKDLRSLLAIMDTFNKYIFRLYDIQMTDSLTISKLALNIFLKDYLKDSKIPVIRSNMYKDIKQAYFGGITEVYKPYGKDLFYYDVNSLYPYSALNSIPGNKCTYTEDFGFNGVYSFVNTNLNDLFGFFYCDIETDKSYIGLLPVRHLKGVVMPQGKWSGWYFSEELKFAATNNYKIKVIKGYNFNKLDSVFDKYVSDLYKIKSTNTGHIKTIAKSLLNNLLGRFGMDITKPITRLVNKKVLDELLCTRVFNSPPINITDNDYIVCYYPEISRDICESHDLDYAEVYNSSLGPKDMEYYNEFRDVSLTTAAAVTSYARIYMSKIKLDILSKGGSIYYTDTDSIVTDIPLDSNIVGDKLGQFKLEGEINEAYFITSKTYCLHFKERNKGKYIHIKVKGGYNGSLNKSDFIKMYDGFDVEALKRNTITNKKEGFVLIGDKNINLNFDSYEKRDKVYSDGKWVNTSALNYDHLFGNEK